MSFTISGKYVDSEAGFEIELPEGWTGIKLGPLGAIVSPYGVPFSTNTSSATMMINIVSIAMLGEGLKTVPRFEQPQDSMINATAQVSRLECMDEKSYINLNGMISMHAISECKNPDDKSQFQKSNIYNVATKDNLISVGLSSNSEDAYNAFVDAFEHSIQTLVVKDAADHRVMWNEPLGLKYEVHKVKASGKDVDIRIKSNSIISNFAFDESKKQITFTASGQNGINNLTVIPVSKVLQGPFSVTLDGKAKNDYQIADDRVADELLLEIGYGDSSHDIVITGTEVLPEFPLSVAAIIMILVLGMIATLGRVRLF